MPSSLCRLQETASAMLESCRGITFIPKRKPKDDVKALAAPPKLKKFDAALLEDEAYAHLLALLSIPAETDGVLASVPGSVPQEEDSLHLESASVQTSNKCTGSVDSQEDGQRASNKKCGDNDLAKYANDALSIAAAQGIPFPWDEQCTHKVSEEELKMMADAYLHCAERCGLSLPGDMHPDDMLRLTGHRHPAVEKEPVDENAQGAHLCRGPLAAPHASTGVQCREQPLPVVSLELDENEKE
eukprot:TRINITY_DN11759_c0_g1_i1.p1 TRINITY_DN11759_c0_g1~~TRINITY_DN11759_c0_g1_i1.p1  ORF type:complete len:243 (+),score=50.23 TRINITY_DN11759_c0_g1_i1:11-739(+)